MPGKRAEKVIVDSHHGTTASPLTAGSWSACLLQPRVAALRCAQHHNSGYNSLNIGFMTAGKVICSTQKCRFGI